MTDGARIRSHYTACSYCNTALYCTVLYCNDWSHYTASSYCNTTATTLSVAICDSSLHSQVSWGPVMWCCHESSCQYLGDKSMISIRASLARPAALQSWGSYPQSAHSATPHCYRTSTGHSITSNKPHSASSALSMGFWSPEKFVPAIVHIFGIAVDTRPRQSWDIYFWAQSECQLSWGRTSSQLTNSCLMSGSGLNFSVWRIMVMRSLSV